MVGMMEGSGTEQDDLTGWALIRELVRDFVDEWRHPRPSVVRYIRCDGCGEVTPHSSDTYIITLRTGEDVSATPREVVCDFCEYVQPRMVDDELPADATVACVGRRYRRFGLKRSRRPCGRMFSAPGAASRVRCPWCGTVQPSHAAR
jgi:ribosomal protein S26